MEEKKHNGQQSSSDKIVENNTQPGTAEQLVTNITKETDGDELAHEQADVLPDGTAETDIDDVVHKNITVENINEFEETDIDDLMHEPGDPDVDEQP